jgi:hypothetical protein
VDYWAELQPAILDTVVTFAYADEENIIAKANLQTLQHCKSLYHLWLIYKVCSAEKTAQADQEGRHPSDQKPNLKLSGLEEASLSLIHPISVSKFQN